MSDHCAQKKKPISNPKRLDKCNKPWVRIVLAMFVALIISTLLIFLIKHITGQVITWPYCIIPPLVLTVIMIFPFWTSKELVFTQNWQQLSMVANSKALMLITVALTIVPLALSTSQAINKQYLLTFDLYLYWVSGLSFFAFILVYKATAPTAFKYTSYRDLIDSEGSVRVLRDSLVELQHLAAERKAPFSPAREVLVPAADIDVIRALDIHNTQHQENIYFLVREYSKHLKCIYRFVLCLLLIAPVFFVITITISKMFAVGKQADQTAICYEGWINATYWSVLKINSDKDKQETVDKCLRELAKNAK